MPRIDDTVDFIVVGSGAGGGTVAANLARAGFTVALLEAGGAETTANYEIPAFFAKACEDPELRWDFIVRHYDDAARQRRDTKVVETMDDVGIWYPRAGTLGGCTAHHALITIRPHDSDWDRMAEITGDPTWRATEMQRYFERIERCRYLPKERREEPHPGGHGFRGWLSTNIAKPHLLVRDTMILRIVWATLLTVLGEASWGGVRRMWRAWRSFRGRPTAFVTSVLDPNDARVSSFEREGLFYVPFSTEAGRRVGIRDLLAMTLQDHPDNLRILTHALATRVLLDREDGGEPRAVGVEYLEGAHLYRADPRAVANADGPIPRRMMARREVIVAGGAFNSPQTLMLSGIGPRAELERHGIEVVVERPGVGRNLQDRYEVGVVCETKRDFSITRGSTFRRPGPGEDDDPQYVEWLRGEGPYATNGVVVCVTRKSVPSRAEPDLFMFCVPGVFRGYHPGWTADIARNRRQFSWLVLKSHTNNRAGEVKLRSADPRDMPLVTFRYLDEGSPGWEADLDAVAEGVRFVRRVNARVSGIVSREVVPGPDVDDDDRLRRFIADEAWGHHASCSNAMGRTADPFAVVDSRFRVIGVRGLRVVDASVFPRIPGFFIVTPIYMIAEKASDEILDEARGTVTPA